MIPFFLLIERLEEAGGLSRQAGLLEDHFSRQPPLDCAWALHLLVGQKHGASIRRAVLRQAALTASGLPEWLLEEGEKAAGDPLEAWSLVLPDPAEAPPAWSLAEAVDQIRGLHSLDQAGQAAWLESVWRSLDHPGRMILNRMAAGAFRSPVEPEMVHQAAAAALGADALSVARRLAGPWSPSEEFWTSLGLCRSEEGSPCPFEEAEPLAQPGDLDDPASRLAFWLPEGLAVQAARTASGVFLWTEGRELVNEVFPDVASPLACLPAGTLVEGEIAAGSKEAPLPWPELHRRLGRKKPSARLQAESPCRFVPRDLLRLEGEDWRPRPLEERLAALASLGLAELPLAGPDDPFVQAVEEGREGLLLRLRGSAYGEEGARRAWRPAPLIVRAVLLYAQGGPDGLYSDASFGLAGPAEQHAFARAVWEEGAQELDEWVRSATVQRSGPVRVVRPELVFELEVEGLALSSRHKSGLCARSVRVVRRLDSASPDEVHCLEDLLTDLERRQMRRSLLAPRADPAR